MGFNSAFKGLIVRSPLDIGEMIQPIYPPERMPVSTEKAAGWAPEPVWHVYIPLPLQP